MSAGAYHRAEDILFTRVVIEDSRCYEQSAFLSIELRAVRLTTKRVRILVSITCLVLAARIDLLSRPYTPWQEPYLGSQPSLQYGAISPQKFHSEQQDPKREPWQVKLE
jgi:hypothetical protein